MQRPGRRARAILASAEQAPKRTRRGSTLASQPEEKRKAEQWKLRVTPRVKRAATERAEEQGITTSAYVTLLVMRDVATEEGG